MSKRPKSRYERSSFQGLSIIEGERKNFAFGSTIESTLSPTARAREAANRNFRLYKERTERRKRSSSLAQTHQIRDIIAKTVEELSKKNNNEDGSQFKTAEDRLKEVLTEAKASGYSAEKIFSILSNSKIDESIQTAQQIEQHLDKSVPKESFVTGLQKLGSYSWKEDELDYIANKFDVNSDGFISLAEFQHYCYHEIPSVAWKAERQRLENASEMGKITTGIDSEAMGEGRFDTKQILYSCGPEVFKTSKLFWKIDLNIGIIFRYCRDLDVITMQIYNAMSSDDFKALYIRKKDCIIDEEALKEAIAHALQTSDERTEEGKEKIKKNTHWEFYSNYLVARLQINKQDIDGRECYMPSLAKLHGDKYATLGIDKPADMTAPQNREKRSWSGKSATDEFKIKVRSLQRDSRSARLSRQSAQELSNLISLALDEIQSESA